MQNAASQVPKLPEQKLMKIKPNMVITFMLNITVLINGLKSLNKICKALCSYYDVVFIDFLSL